ncbi:MAG: histidinol dehydrogenase [Glomeribacter sp. 1016415]|uniref:Histidinol dehydrogenase n=1 Tax=Mycoavidus cysteinexigens TaxID=1553431 RepID=A0A2Z6ESS9_9BURK|nr:histidinol dehydrogenase [Mycoavidus cysteinexigens]MCX8565814.1 histidinol dehydrogenase [Glomeribacter sp. 1016415]BBE08451.1 histidinol dehydrogenase [Mycoavidus cysteinexigens]GAM52835.1 histidinol dehydrogenase [bacterium endosymbiont of Mortierella elongata FMR23-6]GLR00957.1 histidinol dehydrogenase [Mycoavidus cysteinexigens]
MSLKLRRLDTHASDFKVALRALLAFQADEDEAIERAVADILADVKHRGDAAVLDYTKRFDRLEAAHLSALEIDATQLEHFLLGLEPKPRAALEAAARRIRAYHEKQKIESGSHSWQYVEADGTVLGQQVLPLERVGIYVPGGKAAYPSSVLMNALAAQVAGVREIMMVVPTPDGVQNPLVMAAAHLSGVSRIWTIGGAQAIAALAYGTETVPAVDKIVGPGNAYVAAAKRRVFGTVGIDMIAGPSEILILCDGTTDPNWVALDLFSQAEHDELAQAILLCPQAEFIEQVAQAMNRLLAGLPRQAVIKQSLEKRGALIKVRDMAEACSLANEIAPEHLEISALEPRRWLPQIRHAGAIFLGPYSSESLGDYCAGPNHVLPTARTARFSSPLGVYDFIKRSSLIEVSEQGAQTLGRIAAELAEGEGLQAHAQSARGRIR